MHLESSSNISNAPATLTTWRTVLRRAFNPLTVPKLAVLGMAATYRNRRKQLLPKERSFMVIGGLNLPMPHACGLQRTLQHQRMLQAYRDLDSHCSLHAVGFHT